ncbi:MAG TPA: caspase family protein [Hyphomonadaceae bacterium]|nr:caspase family protein [Hyphomonadaceae bacterium]
MFRRVFIAALVGIAVASASAQTAAPPPALLYYAGQPGRLTQDRDRQGGNPFASAFVEVLKQQPDTLSEFTEQLAASNARHSGGWQQMQFPKKLPLWKMSAAGERRVALVLINANYAAAGVGSLPGAAFDAQRIPAALKVAGYDTTLVFDASPADAKKAMDAFAEKSANADAALIYIGGHGIQHRRIVYWMMGDYPDRDAKYLADHAFAIDDIAKAARARSVNLVLYASCRDDPFAGH